MTRCWNDPDPTQWRNDCEFMHAAGHEIGSHTYSHSDLRPDKLDPGKTRSGADPEYELHQAIVSIEEGIGVRPISINPAYGPPAGQLLGLFRKHYPVVRGDDDAEQIPAQHQDSATAEYLIGRLNLAIAESKWLLVAGHGIRTELGRQAEADPDFIRNGKRRDGYSSTLSWRPCAERWTSNATISSSAAMATWEGTCVSATP